MSTENTTLTDFSADDTDKEDSETKPDWTPHASTKHAHVCNNCGGHVSAEFVRQAGDNQGNVKRCINCTDRKCDLSLAALDDDRLRDHYTAGAGVQTGQGWTK